jgi:trans-2-enoyl-CoA reductase
MLGGLAESEVRVQMEFAPIHPADINQLEGRYGRSPALPAVPGGEGAGVVVEVGSSQLGSLLGRRVMVLGQVGTWAEFCQLPATLVRPVAEELGAQQAAMLRLNPSTAWRMLHGFVDFEPGEWLIQNAGNSAVGRAVAQIGGYLGVRVLSVVRRLESVPETEPTEVLLAEGDTVPEEVLQHTKGAPIRLGLNAVGGDSALRLAKTLADGGAVVTYGGMSRQALRIPTGMLIFRDLSWRGFWVTRWWESAPRREQEELLERLESLALRGVLRQPVDRVYGLDRLDEALVRAQEGGRAGKVLIGLRGGGL